MAYNEIVIFVIEFLGTFALLYRVSVMPQPSISTGLEAMSAVLLWP